MRRGSPGDTVSRILNGGHCVSPAAAEAVDAAIRRTGYVVNRHARSLITGRSDSVGFLLTESQERFFEDERRRITRYITAGHVDGVLLVSSHSGDPIATELREAGVPLVACGKPIGIGSKVSYVTADDRDGAPETVRHLLAQGRRRVAVATDPLHTPGGVERLAGYREVLAEEGVAYDERLVVSGDYSRASGEAGAD